MFCGFVLSQHIILCGHNWIISPISMSLASFAGSGTLSSFSSSKSISFNSDKSSSHSGRSSSLRNSRSKSFSLSWSYSPYSTLSLNALFSISLRGMFFSMSIHSSGTSVYHRANRLLSLWLPA